MPGVYLSYPFCPRKCTYCNFASEVAPAELAAAYHAALVDEIRRHRWEWTPETLYLGGGTPSGMDLCLLEAILEAVPGRPWAEATLEISPGDVSGEKAARWAGAGIHRASLGVQSFVARELAQTGRTHTPGRVALEVDLLRQAGFRAVNIDLIAGLPHQTAWSWKESLDWIGRIAPEHVSVYMLEVDEDSRLGREILAAGPRYGARAVPSEDEMAGFYQTAVERLAALGLERYEISNFARPGFESRHNLKYWKLEPYAGFGADAHSFDGRTRSRNPETAAAYVDRWRRGDGGPCECTEANLSEERFFVGLRLAEGIRPTPQEWRQHQRPIQRFLDAGLLEAQDGRLRLTSRGVLLSNEVFQEFLIS